MNVVILVFKENYTRSVGGKAMVKQKRAEKKCVWVGNHSAPPPPPLIIKLVKSSIFKFRQMIIEMLENI